MANATVMPKLGSLKLFEDPELLEVRTWRVKGFRDYLIYYIAREYGMDVLAVMHGSKPPEDILGARVRRRKAHE